MSTWLKKSLSKVALTIVSLAGIIVIADAVQHYAVLKFIEDWLKSSKTRKNTFESKLNLLPLGDASVDILNLVSKECGETLTVKKIHLRKGIFDFNKFNLTVEEINAEPLSARSVTATAQRTTNAQGVTLTFSPVRIDGFNVAAPLVSLESQTLFADVIYKELGAMLDLTVKAPKISVNENEALGLEASGHLTMHPPHNGELLFKIQGIKEFADVLVHSGYLDPHKAQFFKFGGQLLGDKDGNVPLKLRIKNGAVFLGPIKLR